MMPDEIWLIPEREGYHLVAHSQQSSDSVRYIRADLAVADIQAMIREVCVALGKAEWLADKAIREGRLHGHGFRPDTDHNDGALLDEWVIEAGWEVAAVTFGPNNQKWSFAYHNNRDRSRGASDPDIRIARIYAAHKALCPEKYE